MKRYKWCCVNYKFGGEPYFLEESLRYRRTDSIQWFIKDSGNTWRHWKNKIGWRCIKVKVTITPI